MDSACIGKLNFWDSAISNTIYDYSHTPTSRGVHIDCCEWLLTPLGDAYQIVPCTKTKDAAKVIKSPDQPGFFLTLMKVIVLAAGIPLLLALAVRAFDRWDFTYNVFDPSNAEIKAKISDAMESLRRLNDFRSFMDGYSPSWRD